MAQFTFDPSQYPTGSLPTGWTEYNASGRATIQNDPTFGRHLQVLSVNTSAIQEVVLWTSLGQLSAPLEMLALVEGEGADLSFPGVLAFWDSASSGGYRIYLSDRNDFIRIGRVSAATETALASAAFSVVQDVRYWIRARFETSGTIYAKVWQDGDAEPSDWMVSASDSTYTSGLVGFEIQRFGTNRYYWLGVGTEGDSAPSPGGAGGSFSESIVLNSNQTLGLQSQALALDSLSLLAQQLYGQTPKASAQTQSLLALIASILLEAQGERNFSEPMLLSNSAVLAAALRANLNTQIPLAYQTELIFSFRSLIAQTVELASVLNQTFDPKASAVATTILNLASSLLQVAQAMIAVGAPLESITRVELVGSTLILELRLPSGRTLRIEADSRTFVIEPESRVIKIEP